MSVLTQGPLIESETERTFKDTAVAHIKYASNS